MKNLISFLAFNFLVFFLSTNLFSQEDIEPDKPKNTFNFYFINGYAVSYNFYNAESFYLRAQLDISTSKEDMDADGEIIEEYTNGTQKYSTTGNTETNYFSIGASAHIIFPVYKTNYGKVYLGTGPLFNYSNQNYNNSESRDQFSPDSNVFQYSTTSSITSNEKNYDVGALVLVGIEGIITDNISLFVEAYLKGGRKWKKTEWESLYSATPDYHSKQTSTKDGDGWFYEAQFIRLGVSISL